MIDELAGRFGIHRTTVMTHLDRHGVERRTGNVQRRIDEALRLYESGWSLARIGTEFGVNAETARRALRGAGVSMRPRPGG